MHCRIYLSDNPQSPGNPAGPTSRSSPRSSQINHGICISGACGPGLTSVQPRCYVGSWQTWHRACSPVRQQTPWTPARQTRHPRCSPPTSSPRPADPCGASRSHRWCWSPRRRNVSRQRPLQLRQWHGQRQTPGWLYPELVRRWPGCHWQLYSSTSCPGTDVGTPGSRSWLPRPHWAWSRCSSCRSGVALGLDPGYYRRGWVGNRETSTDAPEPKTTRSDSQPDRGSNSTEATAQIQTGTNPWVWQGVSGRERGLIPRGGKVFFPQKNKVGRQQSRGQHFTIRTGASSHYTDRC